MLVPRFLTLVGMTALLAGCELPLTVGALGDGSVREETVVSDVGTTTDVHVVDTGASDAGFDAGFDVGFDAGFDVGSMVCASGFGDCNATTADGCETNLISNASNCGACGNVCPSGRSCMLGVCVVDAGLVCAAGMSDCDANAANGCETNLTSSASNCGACGRLCSGGQSCVAGACTGGAVDAGTPTDTGACAVNHADCNGVAADGCETDLTNSNQHCGFCGAMCPAGRTCTGGLCR